jgi:hypothetical protein
LRGRRARSGRGNFCVNGSVIRFLRFDPGHSSTGESAWLCAEGDCFSSVSLLGAKPGAFVSFHPAFGEGPNEKAPSRLMQVLKEYQRWYRKEYTLGGAWSRRDWV